MDPKGRSRWLYSIFYFKKGGGSFFNIKHWFREEMLDNKDLVEKESDKEFSRLQQSLQNADMIIK